MKWSDDVIMNKSTNRVVERRIVQRVWLNSELWPKVALAKHCAANGEVEHDVEQYELVIRKIGGVSSEEHEAG